MNASIFWRLVWKEYRLQRAFWLAMLVFVPLLLGISMLAGNTGADWIFSLSLALASLYALGCGATLFAAEREAGTFDFQRSAPVSSWLFFAAKVTFAAASTALLVIISLAIAATFARTVHAEFNWIRPESAVSVWAQGGLIAAELLLWGVLFSLLLSQPLKAVAFALGSWMAVAVAVGSYSSEAKAFFGAVGLRMAVAVGLAAVDLWLGLRWFRPATVKRRPTALDSSADSAATSLAGGTRRSAMFSRLVWHEWRQSRGMLALLTAMALPAILFWLLRMYAMHSRWGTPSEWIPTLSVLGVFATAAAPLAGAWVFVGDWHFQSYRFLADRGISPGLVWLSRQVVWLSAVAFWIAAGLLAILASWPLLNDAAAPPPDRFFNGIAFAGLLVFAAYAVGQSCSMFFRSSIVAGFLSLVLSALLCSWAGLMWWLDVPLTWSVAPIPASLLLATWLRTPGWLAERRTLRSWLAPALAVVVPAIVILAAVPVYRVVQIPAVAPGFDIQEIIRPPAEEDRTVLDLYRRAGQAFVPRERFIGVSADSLDVAWAAANEEAIALALEASRLPVHNFDEPPIDPFGRDEFGSVGDFGRLLVISAEFLEREGNLDAALDRYFAALRTVERFSRRSAGQFDAPLMVYQALPSWAAASGQTRERIARAIDELSRSAPRADGPVVSIERSWRTGRSIVEADPEELSVLFDDSREASQYTLRRKLFPWEQKRAIRLLDWLAARDLALWRDAMSAIQLGDRPAQLVVDFDAIISPTHEPWTPWAKWRSWGETIPLFGPWSWPHTPWLLDGFMRSEAERRATLQILALQAWKLDHGSLPPSLDVLTGKYLDKLPADPYATGGQPLRYFPAGLPVALKRVDWGPVVREETVLEANVPFLWSLGPQVVVREQGNPAIVVDRYRVHGGAEWQVPATEQEVWQSGLVFQIP